MVFAVRDHFGRPNVFAQFLVWRHPLPIGHEHLYTTQKYTHLTNPYIEESLSKYWDQSMLIGGDSDGK